ncbi:dTDP-4-dehydrorhamnose reductase [Halomonas organivorans]|uniref:dTDP-4-dehydrorhamnose reductase n=1 Tax=Halomonas organivorans TaxID=257772 RepID=A0A7W5C109_9GAMM|nr:dTDP-4-dehydrorhamnose reductase [Halomonas organivorans]MBB3142621.1 dTDP-4-dehydrorhamnose reductase [Halomonas organivorans]
MKILLLGGSGQVGFELRRTLVLLGEVDAPNRHELDLGDARAVSGYLEQSRPDLIVNAAAWTAVDKAEESRDAAYQLNAALPEQLAGYASQHHIALVHYSTDYVYPGDGDEAWREDSPTEPLSVYGASKLAGDRAIQSSGCSHLVFRTSWVYAARGHNFMKTMLRLGHERDALKIVDDQIGAPTPARLIAQVSTLAIPPLLSARLGSGIYHLAPRGETSWHGFASEIFHQAEGQGESLMINPAQVVGIPTVEYPTPAARPLNSRLSVEKLEQALGIKMPEWRTQLALTLEEHISR